MFARGLFTNTVLHLCGGGGGSYSSPSASDRSELSIFRTARPYAAVHLQAILLEPERRGVFSPLITNTGKILYNAESYSLPTGETGDADECFATVFDKLLLIRVLRVH